MINHAQQWFLMIHRVSFCNYFRPPVDSYSGQLLRRLELNAPHPDNLGLWRTFHTTRRGCSGRVAQFSSRCFLSIAAISTVVADAVYWVGMTLRVKPIINIGLATHLTNLISYIALLILICAMPFGYLPDIDPMRPLRGDNADLNSRVQRAYYDFDPLTLSRLIQNSGLTINGFHPGYDYNPIILSRLIQLSRLTINGFHPSQTLYDQTFLTRQLLTAAHRMLFCTILETGKEPDHSSLVEIIFNRASVISVNHQIIEEKLRIESDFQHRKTIIKMFLWAQAYFYGESALNIGDLNPVEQLTSSLVQARGPHQRFEIVKKMADLPDNPIFSRLKKSFSEEPWGDDYIMGVRLMKEQRLILSMQNLLSMRTELAAAQDEAQKAAREARFQALAGTDISSLPSGIAMIIAVYSDIRMPLPRFSPDFT